MKTLKSIKSSFLLMMLAVLVGCSDQITSSGESGSSEKGEEVIQSSPSLPIGLPVVSTFRTQIRLKPYKAYTFNLFTTGFDRLYSIDINDVTVKSDDKNGSECDNIIVYSPSNGNLLGCHSNGFDLKEIVVENKSSSFLDLDIILRGFKQKKGIKLDEK